MSQYYKYNIFFAFRHIRKYFHYRTVVAHSPEISGPGVCPERLGAAEAGVGDGQQRVRVDKLPHRRQTAGKIPVYLFPHTVVFDCALSFRAMPEVIVEIPHAKDAAAPCGLKGIAKLRHTAHRGLASALLPAAYLGRVVIHQNGQWTS